MSAAVPVTLVTGATGFIGKSLVESLRARTLTPLRILTARGVRPLPGIEVVDGSITDPAAVRRALDGVECVYHLAGLVSRDPDDQARMFDVHVKGTRILCSLARATGVRRIVLCSTSGTIAVTRDGKSIPDEEYPRPVEIISRFPYYLSKLYQEKTAQEECAGNGRPAVELVTVHPSLVLGPGDERLSSTGDVQRFLDGRVPLLPPGGLSFVDARDVASALVSAMEKGRAGERYLLGGPNWTFEKFFGRLARVSGRAAPRLRAPARLMKFAGYAADTLYRHFGRKPPVDRVSAEMSTYFWYLDPKKAEGELSFSARDPGETLADTVRYLRGG